MRLRQPVLVEWVDSRQPVTAWRFLSQITPQGAVRCLSVGWLVARDAETLLLAANLGDTAGETPQACGVMEIPRRAVLRVRRLRPTGPSSAPASAAHPARAPRRRASSARPA